MNKIKTFKLNLGVENIPHLQAERTKGMHDALILVSLVGISIGKQGIVLVHVCAQRTDRKGAKVVWLGPAIV